jgi:methylase of polypeptide subunit release factors
MRKPNDFYPTPAWMVEHLLKNEFIEGNVLEPCAGKNDITNALISSLAIKTIVTNDIDKNCLTDHHFDARNKDIFVPNRFDWIITNPPFSI